MGVRKYNIWTKADKDIPRPAPLTVKDELVIGNKYVFRGKRLELVGKYEYFARFKDKMGFFTCFLYTDLQENIR